MGDFFDKPDVNISFILEREKKFYEEILLRRKLFSKSEKDKWSKETILERKQRLSKEMYNRYSGKVAFGPFCGMQLSSELPRTHPDLSSLLLGFYEYQVVQFITSEIFKNLELFVDIGASEGYYPIGMLYGGFCETAIAYEDCPESAKIMMQQAQKNGVKDRLVIKGKARHDFIEDLDLHPRKNTLILCDIAGGEFDLFTEEVLFHLSKSTVIIEIHDWYHDDFIERYSRLLSDADKFFDVKFLKPKTRPIEEIYDLHSFTDDNRLLVCSEHRPSQMRFVVLNPKTAI